MSRCISKSFLYEHILLFLKVDLKRWSVWYDLDVQMQSKNIPVCKLNVKVSGWMVLKKILSSRKNAFFIKLYGKFNFQVIIVKAIKNNSSLSFSWVQIKKSIVDTVKLHQWCRFQSGNNGCAQYLVFNITIKFKVVVRKQRFNYFDYFFILALPEVS